MSPADILAEGLAILLERTRIDDAHMSASEAELAAWDHRQGLFFEAVSALPSVPDNAGMKALAFAVIHSSDCGMPPYRGSLDGQFLADLWETAGHPEAGS